MTRTILLLLFVPMALPLASCGTAHVVVPTEVKLEVPVPCIAPGARPPRPALRTEADLMAMDRYRRTLAAWSDLKRLEGYAAELEAMVEACSRIPAMPP